MFCECRKLQVNLSYLSGRNLSERLPGKIQTNQKSELYVSVLCSSDLELTMFQAICRTLETDPEPHKPLDILTDSAYSISCASYSLDRVFVRC